MLARRAERDRAAVLVVGSRTRTPLVAALLGSVSQRLAASAGRLVMGVSERTLKPERLGTPAVRAVRAARA